MTWQEHTVTYRRDFKDIKFPVKIWGIYKNERKDSIDISVFGCENKLKYPIYVSRKCCEDKHADLLLIGDTFMYDHT